MLLPFSMHGLPAWTSPWLWLGISILLVWFVRQWFKKAVWPSVLIGIGCFGGGLVIGWLSGVILHLEQWMNHVDKRPLGSHPLIPLNPFSVFMHQNPSLLAVLILILVVLLVVWCTETWRSKNETSLPPNGEFVYTPIVMGNREDNRAPIVIENKDRFINTLIVGSIGTGKTSRILTKSVYQDLLHIAEGVPMDTIVVDPDGGFVDAAIQMAQKLGVPCDVIDLRGRGTKSASSMRFNPFEGRDVADIIDNVRAVLKEQMGKQEGFFENAQDDLIRTVISVQVPLWPDTDFVRFAELMTDPLHFRFICDTIYKHARPIQPTVPHKAMKKLDDDMPVELLWKDEESYLCNRYDDLPTHIQSSVLSAARSYLVDTRTEQKLEHLEKITKGLKIVINELSTNPKMREVLGKSDLPVFDFQSFFARDRQPGRLIAVITDNRPIGDLFGKLFLVSMKMYGLRRAGTENTRRPVYVYVDEFPRYATDTLSDWFAQGRKYRLGITVAIQTRAQLQLTSNKGFVDVVEGSCRNKIYFPSPAPADARYLQEALGTITTLVQSESENKLGWFDARKRDPKVTTTMRVDPRFRIEELMYQLKKDEAVFLLTVDNQAKPPMIGKTSYADEWLKQNPVWRKRASQKRKQGTPSTEPEAIMRDDLSLAKPTNESPELESVSNIPETVDTHQLPLFKEEKGAQVSQGIQPQEPTPTGMAEKVPVTFIEVKPGVSESPQAITEQKPFVPERISLKRNGKKCPVCSKVLMLTDDERKYRCDACGYERKNRAETTPPKADSKISLQ